MRARRRGLRTAALAIALAAAVLVAACTPGRGRLATSSTTTVPPAASAAASSCTETPTQSLASFQPGNVSAEAARAQTIKGDVLVVGVSADTFRMGYRNPATAELVGFDVDILREVARALFGDPNRIEFKVVNFERRTGALEDRQVDLVAATMTITCGRWEQIDFSTEYLRAGRKLLVRSDDADRGIQTLDQLAGRRVCATRGGTSLASLQREHPEIQAVGHPDLTDCVVAFQQGDVDAIVSDDIILAGFAAQDPYARVVGPSMSDEPYGIGVRKGNVLLTQFVNRVLENLRAGTWRDLYRQHLGDVLDVPAQPPPAVYGRRP